jgi:hypothetical protein
VACVRSAVCCGGLRLLLGDASKMKVRAGRSCGAMPKIGGLKADGSRRGVAPVDW